jgi:hypothetical protein
MRQKLFICYIVRREPKKFENHSYRRTDRYGGANRCICENFSLRMRQEDSKARARYEF